MHKYKAEQEKYLLQYIEKNEHDIFETHMGRNWISNVSCMSMKILQKYREKQWDWSCLSNNKAISKQEKIATRKIFPWCFTDIIETMDDYLHFGGHFQTQHPFFFTFSKKNKNICKEVEVYPDFPWNWDGIAQNQNVTESFILKHLTYFSKKHYLVFNRALSVDFLLSLKIPMEDVASNPNLNEKILGKYLSKDMINKSKIIQTKLSENTGISVDFILSHPEIDWNYEVICFREDLTENDILKYNLFFKKYKDIVSTCSNISKKFLQTYKDTDFDFFYRWHRGVTIKEVMHLPVHNISMNTLEGTTEEKVEFCRAYYAVKKIETCFLKSYWSTEYKLGRKRLMKEYDELYN